MNSASSHTDFNCACCGGGLSLSSCTHSNRIYKGDWFRTGWNTPLSVKMTDLLQKEGFVFKEDPQNARLRELK